MDSATVLATRLRSHLLSAPAPTVAEAASHMLATQAQEFWGGRWALAARTRGRTTIRDVDAAFEQLQARGVEVVQEPIDQPYGVRDCALRDPAGNLIRLVQQR